MSKILYLSLFTLLPLNSMALPGIDPHKATVCTITLNSSNEREIFRAQVQKDQANYNPLVELTDMGTAGDWFEKACASGIKCDQLVISGHFTDGFGGTSEGIKRRLALSKIEKMGCMKSCSGVLDHPYEVYLLGCNTVATKAPDNRTPDVYLSHLLEDGVVQNRAEMITETRYGKMGDDNRSSVGRAFRGSEKIMYGFTARGPSGATIEPMLKDYFSKTTLHANLNKAQAFRMTGTVSSLNTLLGNSLRATAYDHCEAGADDEKDRRICKLIHPRISVTDKLDVIEDSFTDDQWPKYVPTINKFFREHPVASMTAAQKAQVKALGANSVIKRQATNLMNASRYQAVKSEWAFFLKSIGADVSQPRPDVIGDIIKNL